MKYVFHQFRQVLRFQYILVSVILLLLATGLAQGLSLLSLEGSSTQQTQPFTPNNPWSVTTTGNPTLYLYNAADGQYVSEVKAGETISQLGTFFIYINPTSGAWTVNVSEVASQSQAPAPAITTTAPAVTSLLFALQGTTALQSDIFTVNSRWYLFLTGSPMVSLYDAQSGQFIEAYSQDQVLDRYGSFFVYVEPSNLAWTLSVVQEGPAAAPITNQPAQQQANNSDPNNANANNNTNASNNNANSDGCIDINSANLGQLRKIKSISKPLAEKIIEYRQNQRFNSLDDLINIEGIAKGRINTIREQGLACVK
ncbi:MAG: helix-hairpin-helix domain-containing protein [Deinococcales bacterium]